MEKSFIFDAVNVNGKWDRQYFAKDYADYFSTFISNGIFPNPSTNLQVIANNDMTVTLKAGKAFINGRYYHNTDNLELKFDIADGVLDRVDTVVIQCRGLIDNGRKIIAVVKKGEFSSEPVPPPITRNNDIWELRIANIYINHGVVKITQADIEDTRLDRKNCGLVSQMVQTVDTTTLYNQIQSDLQNFKDIEEVDFKNWVDTLKVMLDENVAGNLLNLINAKADKTTVYTKQETDTKLSEKADSSFVWSLSNKLNTTRTYTLTHNRAEATTIKGVTSDVGVDKKSPDNPYTLTGVETNGVTLYNLPNGVCDEYNAETGVLTKRVGKVVLNGSEDWLYDVGFNSTLTLAKIVNIPSNCKKDIKGNIISDKFITDKTKTAKEPYYIFNHWSSSIYISLNLSDIGVTQSELDNKDLTKIKQWLSKNPVTVLYELATPETIQLTPKTTYQHTLDGLPNLDRISMSGKTSEIGTGEKSPNNPYVLEGVPFKGKILYNLPNGVADEYNAETGVLTKRVEKIVLDGSEVFIWADKPSSDKTETGFTIQFVKNGKTTNLNLCASNLVPSSSENITGMRIITNQGAYFHKIPYNWIGILGTDTAEVAKQKIKQWLSKNPVTVLYELETPEVIKLTPTLYQCQFIATADYTEGDVFTDYTAKPTGEETVLPDKAFVKGDIVSVLVDMVNNKLVFKIGGSGVNQTLPPQIRSFAVTSGNKENKLSWQLPVDTTAYEGLTIVRKIGSAPTKISDGTKINLSKTATSYTDTGLTNDVMYYYRAFPYNSKKQYQTDIVGAVVSGTPKAFSLPTYTGQHAIFGDINEGRIEMYTSGTLTLSKENYDVFLVGGGSGGEGTGGSGGFTKTENYVVNNSQKVFVNIGAGGETQGGDTLIKDTTFVARGGHNDGGSDYYKGAGGSGGGCQGHGGASSTGYGGAGGSDGSDGEGDTNGRYNGEGQHTTTRAFGESTGTLYAGGGGGSSLPNKLGGAGGAGGGGRGATGNSDRSPVLGEKGTPNTGGGGGGGTTGVYTDGVPYGLGGSGIAIIRWKRN